MKDALKGIGSIVLGLAVLVAIVALFVVFIRGATWAIEHLLSPLVAVGWVILAIDIVILLPLSAFKPLRDFTGSLMFISSYVFGLITWMFGFVFTYALWGLGAVIFGLLFLGGGVVPLALLATMFKGHWEAFFTLFVLLIITFVARASGMAIASSSAASGAYNEIFLHNENRGQVALFETAL